MNPLFPRYRLIQLYSNHHFLKIGWIKVLIFYIHKVDIYNKIKIPIVLNKHNSYIKNFKIWARCRMFCIKNFKIWCCLVFTWGGKLCLVWYQRLGSLRQDPFHILVQTPVLSFQTILIQWVHPGQWAQIDNIVYNLNSDLVWWIYNLYCVCWVFSLDCVLIEFIITNMSLIYCFCITNLP